MIYNIEYNFEFITTYLYTPNDYVERRKVFYLLTIDRISFLDTICIIMGDFNTILHPYEKYGGGKEKESDMEYLKKILDDNNQLFLDLSREYFNWKKTSFKKIDRVIYFPS